jgi:hypothetical protein
MNIIDQANAGNIVMVPLNGTPTIISDIPDGFAPHYSGSILILAGEQGDDTNLNIKSALQLIIKGDAVVLSQDTWHRLTA